MGWNVYGMKCVGWSECGMEYVWGEVSEMECLGWSECGME